MVKIRKRKKLKKPRVCVFTLTYQRPEYIERSIESLYKRAGCNFDLYVFDDASNEKTKKKLKKLREKYHFKLIINNKHLNIFKSFYTNLEKIPSDYDYYVKFDSDVEILSDNLFPLSFEIFEMSENVAGLTPRVEGIMNSDRYDAVIEFYKGHALKLKASIVYGCCLIFTSTVFNTFKRLNKKELVETNEKWGIDSKLYEHSLKHGKFIIVEDLSVYHIDNTFGQRRKYADYYIERLRWRNIDLRDIWFIKASKNFAPKFIKKEDLLNIQKNSTDYDSFFKNCKDFICKHKIKNIIKDTDEASIERIKKLESQKILIPEEQTISVTKIYKITSPLNFRPDEHIIHGTSKLYREIPDWAKNNPRVVIEEILTSNKIS